MCSMVPDLVICELKEHDVVHDAEMSLLRLGIIQQY